MIIYGKNPIKDLFIKDRKVIKEVWIQQKRHQSFYKEILNTSIKLNDIKSFDFRKWELRVDSNHQGIIAIIDDPKIFSLKELIDLNKDKQNTKLLLLDQIEDPQNFGAILRNASAFGVDGVLYPSRNSAKLNSTVMKTSAGTWMNLNLCETYSFNQVVDLLKKEGYWIVVSSLDGNKTLDDIYELNQPLAIILGNEGKGVRKSLQDKADFKIKIDMNSDVESLNVSSTAAIILHYLK